VNPERWQQIERIFQGALEREPHERASFLDQACGDDPSLREKLEALLRSHEGAGSFLRSPASLPNGGKVRAAAPELVGQRLGSYELKMHVGSGGMGDVYRARDTQLRRDVAIKVLPREFSRDPDRVARFQREAVALAALNHSNIAAIHDLDEIDGTRFLVMEFVEGETLAARLKLGPLSVGQAIDVCRQIAAGLEGAHAKGVHHRDLKPDNIQITPDGRVKLLDFGLAKMLAAENEETDAALRNLTLGNTIPGVILGTAPYLSPEQARGLQPDKRSDIWAFGCVMFEALTGRQAFPGATIMDVFAAILKSEPDWTLLPPELPSPVQSLLRRCLQKEPSQRLPDIAHARMTLEDVLEAPSPVARRNAIPSWKIATAVGILAAGIAAMVTWNYRPSTSATVAATPAAPASPLPPDVASDSSFNLPQGQNINRTLMSAIAISPDGTNMVFVSNDRLYTRPISATQSSPIPGTAGALNPVFSPDGKWIAFWGFNDRTLKKIAISGGAPVTLTQLPIAPSSLSWEGDSLVYATTGGILAVPASGGSPEVWLKTQPPELANNPQSLDGGNAVLFSLTTGTGLDRWDTADVVILSRKTGQRKVLLRGGSDARHIPGGYIVYAVGNTLFAVPFDLGRQEITGKPAAVLDGVMHAISSIASGVPDRPSPRAWPFGVAQFDFSRNGTLVYIPGAGSQAGEIRVVPNWVDQIRQQARSQ
jgi:serine/threonine-protein kinase